MARDLGVVVVTARGPLDATSGAVLKDILFDLIEGQGNLRVIVDIHDMAVVDPSSLNVLVEAATLATGRGGRLTLAHPPKVPLVGEAIGRARAGGVAREGHLRSLPPLPPDPTGSDRRRMAMARHPSWTDDSPDHLRPSVAPRQEPNK